jgi:hypothetical protein
MKHFDQQQTIRDERLPQLLVRSDINPGDLQLKLTPFETLTI